MPGYIQIGQRYNNWSEYGDTGLMVLNPKQMFLDLIKYKQKPNEPDLKTICLVGGQGSGKTVAIRYLVHMIRNNPSYKGITSTLRTNDLRIIGDKRYKEYFEHKKVIILIIDDAIDEGTDSRRAMSGANVETTQQFCITRHIVEENYETDAIIFMIFATQVYTRLDPTIRDTAQLTIFTEYYDQKWFLDLFTPEDAEVLRIATYEGMFSSNLDARRFALARTITGDTATIEIPYSSSKEVPYPYIDRSLNKNDLINKLTQILLNRFDNLDDYTKGELKGFLFDKAQDIEKDYYIDLKRTDFTTAIDRASFIQKDEFLNEEKENERNNKVDKKTIEDELVDLLLNNNYLVDLSNFTKSQIKGYLKANRYDLQEKYGIELTDSDFVSAIDQALYKQKVEQIKQSRIDSKKDPNDNEHLAQINTLGWDMVKILYFKDNLGLTFQEIEDKFGIPHSNAYRYYNKYTKIIKNCLDAEEKGLIQPNREEAKV